MRPLYALSPPTLVTSTADDGSAGTLRYALAHAGAGGTVTFDPTVFATSQTITLNATEVAIGQDVTLEGPGAGILTIDAGGASRVLHVTSGTVLISGLHLTNGNASGDYGGGLLADYGSSVTLENATVDHSAAGNGGGISNEGTLTLVDCTVSANSTDGVGGGLYIDGETSIAGSTFAGNSASSSAGGGLYCGRPISLTNCTLTNNSAFQGGALFCDANVGLTSCTLARNTATSEQGGGLYIGPYSDATLHACLFAANSGGDIFAAIDTWAGRNGTITSEGSNLTGDGDGNGITNGVNHDQTGVADAKLDVLADNGGPTQTCALLAGSGAIDADYDSGSAGDQRGFTRAGNGVRSDIGAFESGAHATALLSSITVTAASASVTPGGTDQLTATATYSDSSTADVTSSVTWASDTTATATIDSAGLATAVAQGTTQVTAALNGVTSSPVTLTVTSGLASGYLALWNKGDGKFSVWEAALGGGFVPHDFDTISGFSAQALAATPDGHAHVLLTASDGSINLCDALVSPLLRDHNVGTQASYGPFAGWTAQTLVAGPDGVLRVLWTRRNGMISLWKLHPDGAYDHAEYGPFPGWTARFLSAAPDNTLRVLWTHTSGQVSLWVMDALGDYQDFEYVPYPDWSPSALATGPGGLSHITWNHAGDGLVSLWSINDAGEFMFMNFGPYIDWTAGCLAVGADDTLHVGWSETDGKGSLWDMPATSSSSFTATVYGPYYGWHLLGLSAAFAPVVP